MVTIKLLEWVELGTGCHAEGLASTQETISSDSEVILGISLQALESGLGNDSLARELGHSDHTSFFTS